MKFTIPVKHNKLLAKVMKQVEANKELEQYWKCANITAIDRLGFNDHGPVHIKVVANIALRIMRMLTNAGVTPSVVKDYKLTNNHAELVVVLASILHDVGMSIHRERHDEFGIDIAFYFLQTLLKDFKPEERAIMSSEVLSAMVLHDSRLKPLTVEAGVVRIADALDMEKGRARIPSEFARKDIHQISAMAVEEVIISEGTKKKPVKIVIEMSNSIGMFQVDSLLRERIHDSRLKKYFSVEARVGKKEKKMIRKIEF